MLKESPVSKVGGRKIKICIYRLYSFTKGSTVKKCPVKFTDLLCLFFEKIKVERFHSNFVKNLFSRRKDHLGNTSEGKLDYNSLKNFVTTQEFRKINVSLKFPILNDYSLK